MKTRDFILGMVFGMMLLMATVFVADLVNGHEIVKIIT